MKNITFNSERLSLMRPSWGYSETKDGFPDKAWTCFNDLHLHHKNKVVKDYFKRTKGMFKG